MRFILIIINFINVIFLFGTIGSLETGKIDSLEAIIKFLISIVIIIVTYLYNKIHKQKLINKKYERMKKTSKFMF